MISFTVCGRNFRLYSGAITYLDSSPLDSSRWQTPGWVPGPKTPERIHGKSCFTCSLLLPSCPSSFTRKGKPESSYPSYITLELMDPKLEPGPMDASGPNYIQINCVFPALQPLISQNFSPGLGPPWVPHSIPQCSPGHYSRTLPCATIVIARYSKLPHSGSQKTTGQPMSTETC